jgi:hypothetical protein
MRRTALWAAAALGLYAAPLRRAAAQPQAPAASADGAAAAPGRYRPFPTSRRDAEERVIFRLNVGYGADVGRTGGEPGKTGVNPATVLTPDGDPLRESRNVLLGDLVLGSRGVLLPSMSTYFLSQFQLDANGASDFATRSYVYDVQGRAPLLVYSGYAELNGLGRADSPWRKLYVRAGRQFRYGSGSFVANFDGVTLAYDGTDVEATAFFGRRVGLFFENQRGPLGGFGLTLRLQRLTGLPLSTTLDYLNFDGDRHAVEWSSKLELPWASRLTVLLRLVDGGPGLTEPSAGFGLGRVLARYRLPLGRRLFLRTSLERRLANEVAYDLLSPVPVDIVNVAQRFGVGLDEPSNRTRLTAGLDVVVLPGLESYLFGTINRLDGGSSTSGFDQNYQEFGLAVQSYFRGGLCLGAQYKARLFQLDQSANVAGSAFRDTSGSGVERFQETSAELRYSRGARVFSAGAGGYVRVYSLATPYATADNDARAGGRLDAEGRVTPSLRLKGVFEAAQPSSVLAADLRTLLSVRLLVEASF